MTAHSEPAPTAQPSRPKKKRRIFMWVFLAIQVLFIVWLIGGGISASDTSDCVGVNADACEAGTAIGTGIGIALILGLWCIVDLLLGVGYAVYRLARRNSD